VILIGSLRSPFVRRVATTMRLYGMTYEHKALGHTGDDAPALRKLNPVGRVPALVLDDERVIIDSASILDFLDRSVGADRALTPLAGEGRDRVLSLFSVSTGCMEKAVATFYEVRFRPEDKRHAPWVDRCADQCRDGFHWLESQFEGSWMAGESMSQVDVSTAIYWQFMGIAMPELRDSITAPKIVKMSERLGKTSEFVDTFPKS